MTKMKKDIFKRHEDDDEGKLSDSDGDRGIVSEIQRRRRRTFSDCGKDDDEGKLSDSDEDNDKEWFPR